MDSDFGYSHVLNQDEFLLGIEGAWGEHMGLVHQDPDSGSLPELTFNSFFRLPEYHTTDLCDPSLISFQISHSLPASFSALPPSSANGSSTLPIAHSHSEGFNEWAGPQSFNDGGWEIPPAQLGSSGSWNEPGSPFSSDGGSFALHTFPTSSEELELRSDLLHPSFAFTIHEQGTSEMSRAESVTSVTSFETAMEDPNDINMDQQSPSMELFGQMDGSFVPLPDALELPTSESNLSIVSMHLDPNTERMVADISAGRRQKGRKGPLNPKTKVRAAEMRKTKACASCRRRKTQVLSSLFCTSKTLYSPIPSVTMTV
jgi:hypothetical protein